MKKYTAYFLLILLFCFIRIASAKDIGLSLSWDADTKSEQNTGWEKLQLFVRDSGGVYDYDNPLNIIVQEYVDNLSTPVSTDIIISFEDDKKTTKHFVMRSAAGNMASPDSEEVSFTADLIRPTPIDVSVEYIETEDALLLSWPVHDERVTKWVVYGSTSSGSPYEWYKTVHKEEGISPSISISKNELFPEGEATTMFFVIAAGTDLIYSRWGEEQSITLDNRPIKPIVNFKIFLK